MRKSIQGHKSFGYKPIDGNTIETHENEPSQNSAPPNFLTLLFNNVFTSDTQHTEGDIEIVKLKALKAEDLQTCKSYLQKIVTKSPKENIKLIISCVNEYTEILKMIQDEEGFSGAFRQSTQAQLLLSDLKEILIKSTPLSKLSKSDYTFHHRIPCLLKSLASIIIDSQIGLDRFADLRKALLEMVKETLRINKNLIKGLDLTGFVIAAPDIAHIITQITPLDIHAATNIETVNKHYKIMTTEIQRMLHFSSINEKK